MLNLIKMNMYRMRHAVSTWVIAIVTIVFAFMQFGSLKLLLDDPFNMFDAGEGAKMLGFATVGGENIITTLLHNSNILIIAAVFVVLFANAEHKSGFDKNLIGITNHKWKHALARWISAVIGMTCFLAIGFVVLLGLCALFLNAFSFGSAAAMLKSAGFLYLGMVTFSAIFFFFTTLFKSSAGGIVASLVISLGILNLIYNLMYLIGLNKLDVSTGAFSISMTAVVLPVILLTMRQHVETKTIISAFLILVGIMLAVGTGAESGTSLGFAIMIAGCIIRAFYIVILNKSAREYDPVVLSALLSFIVGIIGFISWFVSDSTTFASIRWTPTIIACLAIYSYFIVSFAQTLNIYAHKKTSAANATIIYSLEIVFSIIWGISMPSDIVTPVTLSSRIAIGVALIVFGNILVVFERTGRRAVDAN